MADDLNEILEEEMDDATVITVPIDATLSNSGEAADAAAVGAALAGKADVGSLVNISVNGESADNQGAILIDGSDIPVSGDDATKIDEAIEALEAKTAATIPMTSEEGSQSIADAINALGGGTAETILMATASTETIGERLATIGTELSADTAAITALQGRTGSDIPEETGSQKTIAAALAEKVKSVNLQTPDSAGNVQVDSVPFADNLNSSTSQSNAEKFTFRTTGGYTSVNNGDAWLQRIMGDNVHAGYSPASVSMTATGAMFTATIDEAAFLAEMTDASGTMTFTYGEDSWDEDPEDYGITVTGDPEEGDTITVAYALEVRGTITVSDPQTFVSTGWNLYNHTLGYARVKKYSDQYGYAIAGNYSSIKFSTTVGGEQTNVTVTNGKFDILSDGYIYVTGGDATTTKIWATWSDWQAQANNGVFAAYSQTVIDLSTVMSNYFPYGLLKAGSYQDEINLSTNKAYNRVTRLAYNDTNLETAQESGLDYEYDENYIYLGLAPADQTEHTISVSNQYTSDDHGLEYFTGTDLDVYSWVVYGNNLKNKLERNVLTIGQQTLSSSEKTQVQANIGLTVANNLTTTASGSVLDARQGKTLADRIGTLSSLSTSAKGSAVAAINELVGNRVQFKQIGTVNNNTKTIRTTADVDCLVITMGSSNSRADIFMCRIRTSGNTSVAGKIGGGSDISMSGTSNGASITNSASYDTRVYVLVLLGSMSSLSWV